MNKEILKNEVKDLELELAKVEDNLVKLKDLESYKLICKKGNGYNQYWYRNNEGELVYIPKRNIDFAKNIAQKDYFIKLRNELLKQKRVITGFIDKYDNSSIYYLSETCCEGKKVLIHPIYTNQTEYVEEWNENHPGYQNNMEFSSRYPTERGGDVRSKSEKILADLFYKYGIPYQYEPEFKMHNGWNCYPDFVLLNVRERKTYYWEHFGMTSSKDYADKNLDRLAKYEKSGLVLGDNLIISFETNGVDLDVKLADEKIRKYLL
ncbi:hypothetical protein SAMN02910298_00613 [Pseudobutyrivibrio sp. YE44]|uniref:hypothetical protein n=1 Tax=Pseudobutyrivibrio sp. YE44 TaxID=1520802 RepID=UPI00088A6074|nr:hypothetical protein [Pseudobutyrivibrio sp. YE44]SDB12084.1 hypothetical protein SAMN02910298_00613 [Pseudobutyrivibrio sp. YE44]